MSRLLTILTALLVFSAPVFAGTILVQSTTSTNDSGLYGWLLPKFESETGITVNVVAVGTGQAIKNAQNGDADVLLIHSTPDEEKFVAEGYGLSRHDLMFNDFIIVGPQSDPLGLKASPDIKTALQTLSSGKAMFVSRGDDSGTHKKEKLLWQSIAFDPATADPSWYRSAGQGMGATIRMAIELQAYTMTDRATWLAYGDKRDAGILFEGAPELFNQYGVIVLNPEKFPHVNLADAQTFEDWLLSSHGQQLIADFRVGDQQVFFPNAKP